MRSYPLYIFDLDGTLFRGKEPIPYAVETVNLLAARGSMIRYVSNNSSQSRASFAEKLSNMGYPAVPESVVSSALGAAKLAASQGVRSVFVVGEQGLVETLSESGIVAVSSMQQAEAVVVGICWDFTYAWLNDALQQLIGGARLIATNRDATYPIEHGQVKPGAGSIVAAIEACSGKSAQSVGKPDPFLIQMILDETGIAPKDTLVVGDRYETDVVSGEAAGCDTLLVLSGVTKEPIAGQPWCHDLRVLGVS